MIDLTPIETLLKATKTFKSVEGALDVRQAIDTGVSTSNAVYVMPLQTRTKKLSGGTFVEYENTHGFALVVGIRKHKNSGSNAEFAELVSQAVDTLLGKTLPGSPYPIEVGHGGLLPLKNNKSAFWQQEFSIKYTQEAN